MPEQVVDPHLQRALAPGGGLSRDERQRRLSEHESLQRLAGITAAQHLSFGAGVHYCLGAPLGRLELELSFGTLLRRLPAMAPAAEPAWKPTYILRGLEALHVAA